MNPVEMSIVASGQMGWKGLDLSWSLTFAEGALPPLSPPEMETFSQEAAGDQLVCTWRGHRTLGPKFEVTVHWWLEDDRLCGTIGWAHGNEQHPLTGVCFPVATVPVPRDGQVFSPQGQGVMVKILNDQALRPNDLLTENANPVLQFCAIVSPEGSFYFDQRDTEFHSRKYEYHLVDGRSRIRYTAVLPLPLDGRSGIRYQIPYRSSIAAYRGGWFEAAQIYKSWARQQWWAKRPPVDPRLRDIGMWLWNRGKAEDVIPPVERLQKDAGVPMALDWYWWHRNAYDTAYPDYWPPREGLPVFEKAVARLKEQNIFTQVYINGVTWDMDADHWEDGGKESAVLDKDGRVKAVMFNGFAKRRLAWMCGGGNLPFRKRIRETVRNLNAAGLSGVYLDMIGCASYEPCYSGAHAHAPGGGNYQVMGYRKMLEDIRRDNPGLPLSTEEASEAYMDLCDSAISLSGGLERLGSDPNVCENVPAFSAVYHGLLAVFGNYALPDSIPPFDPQWPEQAIWKNEQPWHRLYPDQFFAEVARAVVWGLQPTVANLRTKHTTDPEFAELYAFLVQTARFYHAHRNFLFDGDMLNPGLLKTGKVEVDFLSRFIFTAEGKQRVFRKAMPALLHSVWKAPDGPVGLVVANYSRENQDFTFESAGRTASGKVPRRSWLLVEL